MDFDKLRLNIAESKAEPVPQVDDRKLDYPAAARVISLYLREFCNDWMPYPDMIADAARQAKAETDRLRAIQPPDWMIVGAVRYAIGRSTCAVQETTDWLVAHWKELPPRVQRVIRHDVEEAFGADDLSRAREQLLKQELPWFSVPHPLGHDCDRESWQRVRQLWQKSDGDL